MKASTSFNTYFQLLKYYYSSSTERLLHLGEDTCISHCVPTGTNLLHTTEVKLPDGAPCRTHNSRGVCISGRCQPIGCDHELNAISQRDVCGEWCGNGTSCVSVSGTYSGVKHPGRKYDELLHILGEANSSCIHIIVTLSCFSGPMVIINVI